jgi:hypothetical protein
MNIKLIASRLSTVAVAALLSVGAVQLAAPSNAQAAACPTSITACGCTISSGTLTTPYTIANDLVLAPTSGDCIDISASFVELNGDGHTITGPGSGTGTIGIHTLSSSQFVLLADATVTGFGTGVQLDGKQPLLIEMVSEANGIGFVFNGPSAFAYDNIAESNLFAGFKIAPTAGGATLVLADSIANTTGFKVVRVSGTAMYAVEASDNAAFGVWLDGAYDSTITALTAKDNAVAGVYLGCNSAGPIGTPCPAGTPTASENVIQSDLFDPSAGATNVSPTGPSKQRYGIAIDSGNLRNRIYAVTGSGNSVLDAFDANPSCGTNSWGALVFTNSFTAVFPTPAGSGNPLCIN